MTTALAPLALYLDDLNRHQPADRRARNADPAMSRDERVERNLALVISIARKFVGRGLDLDDLIQEGNRGLILAAERFDPARLGPDGKPICFGTYATYWIRAKIARAIQDTGRPIRVPAGLYPVIRRWQATGRDMAARLGRPATDAEVARTLGLKRVGTGLIRAAIDTLATTIVTPGPADGPGANILVDQADPRSGDPESEAEAADHWGAVKAALAALPPIEAEVIRRRFGLDGGEPERQRTIAADLGYTRSRIQQVESNAIERLRHRLGVANGPPPAAPHVPAALALLAVAPDMPATATTRDWARRAGLTHETADKVLRRLRAAGKIAER